MALFGLQIPAESFFDAVIFHLEETARGEGLSPDDVESGLDAEDVEIAVRAVVAENSKTMWSRTKSANFNRISSGDVRAELARVVSGGGTKSDSERTAMVVRYLAGIVAQRLAGTDAEFVIGQIGAAKPRTNKEQKPRERAAALEKKAHDLAVLANEFPIEDGPQFFLALRSVFGDAISKYTAISSFVGEQEEMAFAFSPGAFTQGLYWASRSSGGISNEFLLMFLTELESMPLTSLERCIFKMVLWQAQFDGIANKLSQPELRKTLADSAFEALYKMGIDLAGNDRLAGTLRDFESRNVETRKAYFDTADERLVELMAKEDEAIGLANREPIDFEARRRAIAPFHDMYRLRELAVLQAFGTSDAYKVARVIRKILLRHPRLTNEHRLFLRSLVDEAQQFASIDFLLDRVTKFSAAKNSIMHSSVESWLKDFVVGLRADPGVANDDESLGDNPLVRLAATLSLSLADRARLEDRLQTEDRSLLENRRLLEAKTLASLRRASVTEGLSLAAQLSKKLPNGEAILADLVAGTKALNLKINLPADTLPNEKLVVLHHSAAVLATPASPKPVRKPVPPRHVNHLAPPPLPGNPRATAVPTLEFPSAQSRTNVVPRLWAFPSVRRGA